jgi:rhodanese-related sulfurtransferase
VIVADRTAAVFDSRPRAEYAVSHIHGPFCGKEQAPHEEPVAAGYSKLRRNQLTRSESCARKRS